MKGRNKNFLLRKGGTKIAFYEREEQIFPFTKGRNKNFLLRKGGTNISFYEREGQTEPFTKGRNETTSPFVKGE
jgi:hypothetical protein